MASSSSVGDSRAMVLKQRKRKCTCGRALEIKVSGTDVNPNRLFYLCKACGFVGWCSGMESSESGSGFVDVREDEGSKVSRLIEQLNEVKVDVGICKERVKLVEEKCHMLSMVATMVGGFCIVVFVAGFCATMIRK